MNNFNFVGTISVPKDTDKFKSLNVENVKNTWMKKVLTLNVNCGDSRHNIRVSDFGDIDVNKRNVYTMLNKNAEGKYTNVKIPFAERHEKVNDVAHFRRFVLDTGDADERSYLYELQKKIKNGTATAEEMAKYNVSTTEDVDALIEKSYSNRKEFITEYDFIDAVYEAFTKNDFTGVKFKVSGNYQFTKNVNDKGEVSYYTEYIPNRITRVKANEEVISEMSADIIYEDSNAIQTVEDINGNKNSFFYGYLVNYNKNYKKDVVGSQREISMAFAVNMSNLPEKAIERIKEKLDVMTATSKYKCMGIVVDCIDGSPTLNFTEDMLTEDEKLDIDCGITTFEEIRKEKGSVKGDRIKEFRFNRIATGYNSGAKDTNYNDSVFNDNNSSDDDITDINIDEFNMDDLLN